MNKFKGIVLVSDIDGTLIDDNHKMPKENKEAIQYFKAHGGLFTLATGRIPDAIPLVLDGIKLDYPCVCHNGCSIYDFNKNEYIDLIELDKSAQIPAREIMEMSHKSGVEIMTPKGITVIKKTAGTDYHLEFEKLTADYEDDFCDVKTSWLKILFAQTDEETQIIAKAMQDSKWKEKFSIMRTHKLYYEIFSRDASKGYALEHLCKLCNIDLKNVVAIGDNDNDLTMLEVAAVSAAPDSAPSHVKKKADIITKSNNIGAVADLISKL